MRETMDIRIQDIDKMLNEWMRSDDYINSWEYLKVVAIS